MSTSGEFTTHGWGFQNGASLYVGQVPTRSSVAVYRTDGNTSTVLAWCTSQEAAESLVEMIGALVRGQTA